MKTVKMVFQEDKFVDGEIFAKKGQHVEVQPGSVQRWLIRGGEIVNPVVADSAPTAEAQTGEDEGKKTAQGKSNKDK